MTNAIMQQPHLRQRNSGFGRAGRAGQLYFVLSIAGFLVLFAESIASYAAPVTMQFEAEVSTVFDTIPFDSGLNVRVGDDISGSFTFEPQVATGPQSLDVVQRFAAFLLIDGASFKTPLTIADLTLRSFNNSGVADYPPATSVDAIEVGGTLSPANASSFPNIAMDRSSFRIMLWGDDSIFPSAVLPADPIIWNSLQLERFLIVSIRGRSGGSLAFQANVATFYVIPEPSSAALAVLAIAMVARYHLKADRQQSFETTE